MIYPNHFYNTNYTSEKVKKLLH